MDTILKAFEKLGYTVVNKYAKTKICIGSEEISIGLKEKNKQMPHVLSQNETNKAKYGNVYAPNHDLVPTGFLILYIDEWQAKRKNWNETKTKKIEQLLGKFLGPTGVPPPHFDKPGNFTSFKYLRMQRNIFWLWYYRHFLL